MQAINNMIGQLQELREEYKTQWQECRLQKQQVPANSLMAAWILSEQRYIEKKNREMDEAILALQNVQWA